MLFYFSIGPKIGTSVGSANLGINWPWPRSNIFALTTDTFIWQPEHKSPQCCPKPLHYQCYYQCLNASWAASKQHCLNIRGRPLIRGGGFVVRIFTITIFREPPVDLPIFYPMIFTMSPNDEWWTPNGSQVTQLHCTAMPTGRIIIKKYMGK